MNRNRALPLILLLLVPAGAAAQTPAEELDENWAVVCAGIATRNDTSPFALRCAEILNAGPGSGARRSAAALGNNLGVLAAQGRVRRQSEEGLTDIDLHSLNLFVTVESSSMTREASPFENEFDAVAQGALVGLDYLSSETAVAGLTLAYSRVDGDFAGAAGDLRSDNLTVTQFASHSFTDRVLFDHYLAYGISNIETQRNVSYSLVVNAGQPDEQTVQVSTIARGEPRGGQLSAGTGLSFDLPLFAGALLSPHGRMDYMDRTIGAYSEADDAGLALSYREQQIQSITGSLGAELSASFHREWGSLTPAVIVDYVHEFRDDSREVLASFVGDPTGAPITIRTDQPDRDFLVIGGSLIALMEQGFALFVQFDSLAGHRFLEDRSLSAGFRAEL
jgi:outer membrane autotransporter protein